MEGRQPKRRKDKYNPYEIYEKDGKYYVSFRNGEKEYKDLEIGKNVYEAFNTFELQDVSHMNVVDRHLEQSEIWDSSLYERIFQKEENVENTVLNKLEAERLHSAIQQLSEIQRRRLMKYYFEDKKYEQIEENETLYEEYMMDDAKICIAAFGIAARVSKNAVNEARRQGIKAGLIRPITLWPFPSAPFKKASERVKSFISVELSMGQMIEDVRLATECRVPVTLCNRVGGMIPSPDMVLDAVKEAAQNGGVR